MTDNKPTLVWSLYTAGFLVFFTPFVGVIFAYMWKAKADAHARAEFEKQIKVFWRCATIWGAALILMVGAFAMDTTPVGSGVPMLFSIGVLVGLIGQMWFYGRSAYGLAMSLRNGQPKMAAA
ncbi:hypothetical protein [Tateyamaria sp. SN6-1]|uniref:hypothetical protein n=1 Tax=Tateyamaria sp. SN6-1 TaxID=3092148 RepID=UPI0039F4F5C8